MKLLWFCFRVLLGIPVGLLAHSLKWLTFSILPVARITSALVFTRFGILVFVDGKQIGELFRNIDEAEAELRFHQNMVISDARIRISERRAQATI